MNDIIGGLGIIWIVLLIVWGILWFFVPFYISGISDKLKKTNQLLEVVSNELKKQNERNEPN